MKLAICLIQVMVNSGGIPWSSKVEIQGEIKSENEFNYLMDFTQTIKEKDYHWNSDYSNKVVSKNQCIEVSK